MSVAFDPIADNLLTIPIGQVDLSTDSVTFQFHLHPIQLRSLPN